MNQPGYRADYSQASSKRQKGKVIPVTGLCGPEGVQRYSPTLPRPRHQKGVSGQQHGPATLYPGERPGTHFTGGWVGPRAGLDRQKISSPPGFDPGPSNPQSVAIPTELPGPLEASSAKINIGWSRTSTLPYAVMACTEITLPSPWHHIPDICLHTLEFCISVQNCSHTLGLRWVVGILELYWVTVLLLSLSLHHALRRDI